MKALLILSLVAMGIDHPYKESSTNLIYNLLFCDDLSLYKSNTKQPYPYPFDVLYAGKPAAADLQKIADDEHADPRNRVLAYNRLRELGKKPTDKKLLAVIVEVGLDSGLDVLASFRNGTARYINQTGKMLIWETQNDQRSNKLTNALFATCEPIVKKLGPWDQPRRPHPERGYARITFLVSDGLYFGEGPADALFEDQTAGPAMAKAAELMQYLTEKSLQKSK